MTTIYISPEMELIVFKTEDVICTSGDGDFVTVPGGNGWDDED